MRPTPRQTIQLCKLSQSSRKLRNYSTMAPIERITLFKVPNEADVQRLLEQYKVLASTATKVFRLERPPK